MSRSVREPGLSKEKGTLEPSLPEAALEQSSGGSLEHRLEDGLESQQAAQPLNVNGALHNGLLYYPYRLKRVVVEDGTELTRYETRVLRSDGVSLGFAYKPAPRGTPSEDRVLALDDGTEISRPPQAAPGQSFSLVSPQPTLPPWSPPEDEAAAPWCFQLLDAATAACPGVVPVRGRPVPVDGTYGRFDLLGPGERYPLSFLKVPPSSHKPARLLVVAVLVGADRQALQGLFAEQPEQLAVLLRYGALALHSDVTSARLLLCDPHDYAGYLPLHFSWDQATLYVDGGPEPLAALVAQLGLREAVAAHRAGRGGEGLSAVHGALLERTEADSLTGA